MEEVPVPEIRLESRDWTDVAKVDFDKNTQSSLEGWIEKDIFPEGSSENGNVPEGRKQEGAIPKTVKRRVRGKLDRKEITAMKAMHTNIKTLLAAPKPKKEQEDDIAMDDLATLEREQRLERVRLRKLEWDEGWNATATGGPCHQSGVGAPLQQINTRASPHPPSPPLSKGTAHTPQVGTGSNKNIMNVTHTPLIGRDVIMGEQSASITVQSRAGCKSNSKTVRNIHVESGTDSRKAVENHGSPDKLNTQCFNKSPMMINGQLEQFSDISNMIIKWGEEEESILEKEKGVKGARRRSQRIDELCTQFEPQNDGQMDNPDADVRGRGEMKFLHAKIL